MEASPSGRFVWYDPTRESVELYEVEPPKESGVQEYNEMDDWDVPRSEDNKQMFLNEGEDLPF